MANTAANTTFSVHNANYEVHLPSFEGPLELLLHLIEKNELDITKVALAKVTDEFLAHIEAMRETAKFSDQIESLADFLVVATQLLWIKSRALLPAPPQAADEAMADGEDVGDALIRQLRAYRQYKEAAQWLRERDQNMQRSYIHLAPPPRPQRIHIDLTDLTLDALVARAEALMFPNEGPEPQDAIQRPRISILQQIRLIRKRLMNLTQITYWKLLSKSPTRLEAVVTLQAILELVKQRTIDVDQTDMFGDITINPLVPPEEIAEPSATTEE